MEGEEEEIGPDEDDPVADPEIFRTECTPHKERAGRNDLEDDAEPLQDGSQDLEEDAKPLQGGSQDLEEDAKPHQDEKGTTMEVEVEKADQETKGHDAMKATG